MLHVSDVDEVVAFCANRRLQLGEATCRHGPTFPRQPTLPSVSSRLPRPCLSAFHVPALSLPRCEQKKQTPRPRRHCRSNMAGSRHGSRPHARNATQVNATHFPSCTPRRLSNLPLLLVSFDVIYSLPVMRHSRNRVRKHEKPLRPCVIWKGECGRLMPFR